MVSHSLCEERRGGNQTQTSQSAVEEGSIDISLECEVGSVAYYSNHVPMRYESVINRGEHEEEFNIINENVFWRARPLSGDVHLSAAPGGSLSTRSLLSLVCRIGARRESSVSSNLNVRKKTNNPCRFLSGTSSTVNKVQYPSPV